MTTANSSNNNIFGKIGRIKRCICQGEQTYRTGLFLSSMRIFINVNCLLCFCRRFGLTMRSNDDKNYIYLLRFNCHTGHRWRLSCNTDTHTRWFCFFVFCQQIGCNSQILSLIFRHNCSHYQTRPDQTKDDYSYGREQRSRPNEVEIFAGFFVLTLLSCAPCVYGSNGNRCRCFIHPSCAAYFFFLVSYL